MIAIPNISSVSVGKVEHKPNLFWIIVGVGLVLVGLAALFEGITMPAYARDAKNVFIVGGLVIGGVGSVILLAVNGGAETRHFLIIGTNDGQKTFFAGEPNMLERVRVALAEKINNKDEAATYHIDFSSGKIENLNAASVVQGDGNVVAAGDGAEVGTTRTNYAATNSPGAIVGAANTVVDHSVKDSPVEVTTINYGSKNIELVGQWRAYLKQTLGNERIEERLQSLEEHMRSGTPSDQERSSLRNLVGELSVLVQGYPAFATLMQHIGRLAGF